MYRFYLQKFLTMELFPPNQMIANIYCNDHEDGYGSVMLAIINEIPSLEMPQSATKCAGHS